MNDPQKINEAWTSLNCSHDWQGVVANSEKTIAWRCRHCGEGRGIQPLTNMGGTHKVNSSASA